MNNISELDMIKYGDWFSHCVAVPIMYLAELVIVTVIRTASPTIITSIKAGGVRESVKNRARNGFITTSKFIDR